MFSSEIWAMVAALSCPRVALLQVDFVVAAVMCPDLEDAFDICLFDCVTVKAIFLFKEFFENRFIEGLGTKEADV